MEVVGILIEQGADVTAQNNNRSTPLHLAILKGKGKVAAILIERGADVTAQNESESGATPLHLAVYRKEVKVVVMHGTRCACHDPGGGRLDSITCGIGKGTSGGR